MSTPRRPNLFILGAPRCGTTALFEFLGAHPEIFPSRVKEPRYFVPEMNERSLEEYLELFAGAKDETWLLEASTRYIWTPAAPRLIREFSPEARAIVIVRDPVDQIRSFHDLRLSHGLVPEIFWARSDDLATELAIKGDRYWPVVRSGENLARVLTVFPPEDVHVVVYDDFLADNETEYRRVLEFLDVDDGFTPRFRTHFDPRGVRIDAVRRLLWRDEGLALAAARLLLPRSFRDRAWYALTALNSRRRPPSTLDPALAAELWRKFSPDVELLSNLLDRDLVTLWQR